MKPGTAELTVVTVDLCVGFASLFSTGKVDAFSFFMQHEFWLQSLNLLNIEGISVRPAVPSSEAELSSVCPSTLNLVQVPRVKARNPSFVFREPSR